MAGSKKRENRKWIAWILPPAGLFLLFLILWSLWFRTPQEGSFSEPFHGIYRDLKYGFSISIPDGFRRITSSHELSAVKKAYLGFYLGKIKEPELICFIWIEDFDTKLPKDLMETRWRQVGENAIALIKSRSSGPYENLGYSQILVDKRKGLFMEGRIVIKERAYRSELYLVISGSVGYTIQFLVPEKSYEKGKKTISTMIQSFRF